MSGRDNVGYLDHRIKACYPELPPMVGYATTATFRSNSLPRTSDAYASLEKQIERFNEVPAPYVVVFQDLDDPCVSATFGEVMCTAYRAFGAAGLITSGAGRDLAGQGAQLSLFYFLHDLCSRLLPYSRCERSGPRGRCHHPSRRPPAW